MLKFKKLAAYGILLSVLFLSGCVSMEKYQEMEKKRNDCESEFSKTKSENIDLQNKVTEYTSQLDLLRKQVNGLKQDTLTMGNLVRSMTEGYTQMKTSYEEMLLSNEKLSAGNKDEIQKILTNIQKLQEDLQKREDQLKILEADLAKRKAEFEVVNDELIKKEAKLIELQSILDQKEAAVAALKTKVANALMGFQNNGLNVYQKNGKVYVSMDEKLLFASGSFQIDPRGEAALKELAKILEQDPDINIMIEGHTDDVAYNGNGGQIKDNWDLSVMRATTVLKTLLKSGKIDAKRLTASGKGEFLPVDNAKTKEARAKNRRTEIILTPKLDELFKILE
jgi:chemotaxis protein MotB